MFKALPFLPAGTLEYINERRIDGKNLPLYFGYHTHVKPNVYTVMCDFLVPSADFSIEGASVAVSIFIPVAVILIIIMSIYFYFSR